MAGPPLVDSSNANMQKKEEKTVDQPCPKRRRKSIDGPAATATAETAPPAGTDDAAVTAAVATEQAEGTEEGRGRGEGSEVEGTDGGAEGDATGGAEEEEEEEEEEPQAEEIEEDEEEEEEGEGVGVGENGEEGGGPDVGQAPEAEGAADGEKNKPDGSKIARARSAWMLYLADNREKVRKENPGLAVGPMQKILSAMWKGLGEEEAARYAKLAAEDKERMKKELAAAGLTKLPPKNSDSAASSAVPGGPTSLVLPLARVRKAVRLDPAVGNISREGLLLMTKATEVFMAVLAEHAWNIGKQTGRKSVRPSDVADFVFAAPEMYWLKDEFRDERSSVKKKQSKPEASGAKAAEAKGAKKAAVVMKGAKSITSFFQKA